MTPQYQQQADRIIEAAMADTEAWQRLATISTEYSPRLNGSEQLERAIAWAHECMREDGLDNVRLQAVKIPQWVRGNESAKLVAPVSRPLDILGLGKSIGTPPEGIEAPLLVVRTFDELEALGRENVEGTIVLYAVEWDGYERTVRYRGDGPSRAAKLGAVGALVRSATNCPASGPHTGGLKYADGVPKIPAAAVTVDDAMWMLEQSEAGAEIRVKLHMGAHTLPDADSSNVIAEITGAQLPDEVVVMGGHIDSWDAGQGAHDDAAGCVAAWSAIRIVRSLGLRPRRTLRAVMWVDEEQRTSGGNAYRDALGDDVSGHVVAIEMDHGCERPLGFGFGLHKAARDGSDPNYEAAYKTLSEIGALTASIDAGAIKRGGGGVDIKPLKRAGVPVLGLNTVGEHYFDWHHARTDVLDAVDPANLKRAVALLGVFGYVLADMPGRLVPA